MFRTIAIAAAGTLIVTAANAAPSCMTKSEARQAFETSHIYWHGEDHCWDATSPRSHHKSSRNRTEHHVTIRDASRDDGVVVPLPVPDLRKSPEPETDLITATPWVDRWTDVAPVVPAPRHIAVSKIEPMVAPRDVIATILTVLLSIALVEVVFGRRINEHLRRRRRRYFGT